MNYLQRIVVPNGYDMMGEPMIDPSNYALQENAPVRGGVWLPIEYVAYDDLYEAVASVDHAKKTRWLMDKTRETVRTILDCWVGSHYIKEWENVTEGRSIVGFNIHFHPISKKYLPALEQLDRPAADDTIPIDQ